MPKGNVFGKPSAEPNLFELCRGEKTCPKGTFPASRTQSQAMLELCRGKKTCPKGTFPASRAQSRTCSSYAEARKHAPKERLVCRARNSLHGTRCKHARQTRYKSSAILFYPSIYLMYRRLWTGMLHPTAATRGYGRVFKFRSTPEAPASGRGFCRKSDRNEITTLLVRHGI
jgi:hypothetical protein